MPSIPMTARRTARQQHANAGLGSFWGFPACVVFTLAPVLLATRGLALNQPVPDLKAPDLEGVVHTWPLSGKATVILFWDPSHARARSAVCQVSSVTANYDSWVWLVVSGPSAVTRLPRCRNKQRPVCWTPTGPPSPTTRSSLPTSLSRRGAPSETRPPDLAGRIRPRRGSRQYLRPQKTGKVAVSEAAPEALREFAMAQKFNKLGLSAQAASTLESVTAKHPEFRPAWVALGYLRIAAGRVDDAGQCLGKALALDKDATDVAAGMAWLAWKQGRPGEAKNWSDRVAPDDPNRRLLEELRR